MRQSILQFKVENLGPIVTGTIDLAALTVICGENNTGKTYLTYALYGVLKTLEEYIELPEFDIPTLRKTGVLDIDLQKHVIPYLTQIVDTAVSSSHNSLYNALTVPNQLSNKSQVALSLVFDGILTKRYYNEFSSDLNRRIISFVKPENSSILTITALNEESQEANDRIQYQSLIARVITAICFAPVIPKPFILSTERTGAVVFQAALNIANSRVVESAGKVTAGQLLAHLSPVSYPLPIHDNIEFVNSLVGLQTRESELLKAHPDILNDFEDLIGGSYQLQNNAVYFVPKGQKRVRLSMSESSSAVRSLVILGFYLKHVAAPGALLMIDEPELNLHPANQRKLARLLVRLVNAGVRVFATTHSDYIVKEFNTLIMRYARSEDAPKLPRMARYTDLDMLDPQKVRVYMLREDRVRKSGNVRRSLVPTLCEADISSTLGIAVPSFDETIDDMNAIQESLYYGRPYAETA